MLTSSNFKMTFSFTIINIAITTLKFVNKVGAWRAKGMEFLNLSKLLNRFLDWKRIFILHFALHFLKFKENFPKNGRTTNNSLLGTVGTICLGRYNLSNNFLIHWLFIDKAVVTFENTSQVFYFYMKISILEQILKNRNRSMWIKLVL